MTRIASEDDFLALVDRHFSRTHPAVPLGRGDDAAILGWPERTCVSTDLFLENVHFRRSYFSPEDIGYKALAVNSSDIAAMGGYPIGFTLGIVCPDGLDATFWDALLEGMAQAAAPWGIPLVGGDISCGDTLGLCVTIWGRPGASGRFLSRQGALPDDVLFAVGPLGLARTGLLTLEREGAAAAQRFPAAVAAHLRPVARVDAGVRIAEIPGVRALMDVSDGLARDLPRLLGPDRGATLAIEGSRVHPETAALADVLGQDAVLELVIGGEDYALLGSVAPDAWPELAARVPEAWPLGRVQNEPGITVNGAPLVAAGFDHFGQSRPA